MLRLIVLSGVVFGAMLVEAGRATRNERVQLRRGGIEPSNDVYGLMRVAYPGVFLAMLIEGLFHREPSGTLLTIGVLLLGAGKLLKWWAILALGPCWTFRVIVVPGTSEVESGPYRYVRHPNYIGVLGELVGTAFVAGAPVAGAFGTVLFAALMAMRVKVENRALNAILRGAS
jgi:methyltransferase